MMAIMIVFATAIALGIAWVVFAVWATRSSFRSGYWAGVLRTVKTYDIHDGDRTIIERVGPPPKPPI